MEEDLLTALGILARRQGLQDEMETPKAGPLSALSLMCPRAFVGADLLSYLPGHLVPAHGGGWLLGAGRWAKCFTYIILWNLHNNPGR